MDNKNFSRLLRSAKEAKAKMHETLNDYKNNPDNFLPIDDNFWKDTEQRLIQRFKNSSRLNNAITQLKKEQNYQVTTTSIKINKKEYTALIYIDEHNDGYNALVPDLEGCFSYGKTFEEAVEMIKEAAELYCEDEKPEIFQYKAFIGSIEYSQEDKLYFGKLEQIDDLVTYEAETKDELEKSFQNAVDDYIKTNYIAAKTTRPSFKEFKQKALSNENVKKEYDLLELTNFDTTEYLTDKKVIEEYLSQILADGDIDELDNWLNTLCNKRINTEAEYDTALKEVDRLMQLNPPLDSKESSKLEILVILIKKYEEENWAISESKSVDNII